MLVQDSPGRERLAEAVESISEKEGFELKLRRGMVKEEQPHPQPQ